MRAVIEHSLWVFSTRIPGNGRGRFVDRPNEFGMELALTPAQIIYLTLSVRTFSPHPRSPPARIPPLIFRGPSLEHA